MADVGIKPGSLAWKSNAQPFSQLTPDILLHIKLYHSITVQVKFLKVSLERLTVETSNFVHRLAMRCISIRIDINSVKWARSRYYVTS